MTSKSTKKSDRQLHEEHERFVRGNGPRPKYETGPTDEPVDDSHSTTAAPESPALGGDYVPGSANRVAHDHGQLRG